MRHVLLRKHVMIREPIHFNGASAFSWYVIENWLLFEMVYDCDSPFSPWFHIRGLGGLVRICYYRIGAWFSGKNEDFSWVPYCALWCPIVHGEWGFTRLNVYTHCVLFNLRCHPLYTFTYLVWCREQDPTISVSYLFSSWTPSSLIFALDNNSFDWC